MCMVNTSLPLRQLAQEAQVVAHELADVVDIPAQHGDTLDAQPEGEAAINGWVVADATQHAWVHHAGAPHLQPAGVFADAAAFALAAHAVHVKLGARLGEWEVAWTEANLTLAAEHFAGEPLQHA